MVGPRSCDVSLVDAFSEIMVKKIVSITDEGFIGRPNSIVLVCRDVLVCDGSKSYPWRSCSTRVVVQCRHFFFRRT